MRGIRNRVRAYYSAAIEQHGATALGVDWPSIASQHLRFLQLVKLCEFDAPFSLNDFGCGYGALLDYLAEWHRGAKVRYHGIDLSPAMVTAAQARWAKKRRSATFAVGSRCGQVADYSVASGVFNVRLRQPIQAWEAYVEDILADLCKSSRLGFAVNFMLPLDNAPMERELYRTDKARWTTFCRGQLGCTVRILSGYGLREFTLLARPRRRSALARNISSAGAIRRQPARHT